jgi:molybdopterin synthase catalytic subunit
MIALAPDPIDPAALLAEFTREAPGAGAIASFSGLVRPDGGVRELWLDHHPRLTPAAFEALAAEARARFAIAAVAIVHRVGAVATGQPIVFVAVAALHRRAAFDAVDFVMDRLKSKVPLWKQERRNGDTRWIEPRAQDHSDAARWETTDG